MGLSSKLGPLLTCKSTSKYKDSPEWLSHELSEPICRQVSTIPSSHLGQASRINQSFCRVLAMVNQTLIICTLISRKRTFCSSVASSSNVHGSTPGAAMNRNLQLNLCQLYFSYFCCHFWCCRGESNFEDFQITGFHFVALSSLSQCAQLKTVWSLQFARRL